MTRFSFPCEGEVHIFSMTVAADAPQYDNFKQILSPVEQARAERLLNVQAKNIFVAGRCFLRDVLGGYSGIKPECLDIVLSEYGKPSLVENSAPGNNLTFNLSHSGELILLAVTSGRDVGIDLELMRDDLPLPDMSRIAFSRREQQELFTLPRQHQQAAFYRCWTRKEAYMKACGMGFSLPSASFDVSLLPEDPPVLLEQRNPSENQSVWQLFDIAVPAGYCAALAVQGADPIQLQLSLL